MSNPKQATYYYFIDLQRRRNGHVDLETFQYHWQEIGKHKYSTTALVDILHKTAAYLRTAQLSHKEEIKRFLSDNLNIWTAQAKSQIAEFNYRHLSNSLWSLGRLNIRPDNEFLDTWTKQTQDIINEFTPQSLTNSLWAFAKLSIYPNDEFLDAWIKQTQSTINKFNTQDLAGSLWALAVIDSLQPNKQIIHLAKEIHILLNENKNENETLTLQGQKQVHDARLWFDFETTTPPEVTATYSHLEKLLTNLFKKAVGDKFESKHIPLLGHKTAGGWTNNETTFLLEIDGPSHFILLTETSKARQSMQISGTTHFQTALSAKLYPNSVTLRLPFPIGDKILNETDEGAHAAAHLIVETAEYLPAGQGYMVESCRGSIVDFLPIAPKLVAA